MYVCGTFFAIRAQHFGRYIYGVKQNIAVIDGQRTNKLYLALSN